MKKHKQRNALLMIFLISMGATLLSLYYSTWGDIVTNAISGDFFNPFNALTPCTLCWYQRIALFPIAFLSGIALWKRDYTIVYYLIPMAIVGASLALYQYGLEHNRVSGAQTCGISPLVSCDEKVVEYFGFITLPFMSFVVFLLIIAIGYNIIWQHKKGQKHG